MVVVDQLGVVVINHLVVFYLVCLCRLFGLHQLQFQPCLVVVVLLAQDASHERVFDPARPLIERQFGLLAVFVQLSRIDL